MVFPQYLCAHYCGIWAASQVTDQPRDDDANLIFIDWMNRIASVLLYSKTVLVQSTSLSLEMSETAARRDPVFRVPGRGANTEYLPAIIRDDDDRKYFCPNKQRLFY